MPEFNEIIVGQFSSVVALTKQGQGSDISQSKLSDVINYVQPFLWCPDFVYIRLFGVSRKGRLTINIMDEVPSNIRDEILSGNQSAEWIFAFPFSVKEGEKLFFAADYEYYTLPVSSGDYQVIVEAYQMDEEDIRNDQKLMSYYNELGTMPIDVERPYSYLFTFFKSKELNSPEILLPNVQLENTQSVFRELNQYRNLKASTSSEAIYVLNSNYEPVLLEDSEYVFS